MNKNVYYPTYTIEPKSIYGSGILRPNKFPSVDTTTSVITDSFPANKKISPPVYRSGISRKPQDTNGYRVLKKPNNQSHKLDDFYYTSQQSNKNLVPIIKPTFKEKLAQKIKKAANEIVNDKKDDSKNKIIKKLNTFAKSNNKSDNKSNDKLPVNDDDSESIVDDSNIDTQTVMNYIDDNIGLGRENSSVDKFGRNKKMWINDHYLYALEPRYNSVVYPWRAYTWMYPITPNTDNYYIDNINSSPPEPIIVSNDTTNKGNWQSTYLNANMLKENFDSGLERIENKYQQNKCVQNYNILYFIIIVLILSIYFYKE